MFLAKETADKTKISLDLKDMNIQYFPVDCTPKFRPADATNKFRKISKNKENFEKPNAVYLLSVRVDLMLGV